MSVSAMFTGGWMDDPVSLGVTVIVGPAVQATVVQDSAMVATLSEPGITAVLQAGDTRLGCPDG